MKEMTAKELEQTLETSSFVVVDVREDEEVAEGIIPEALHIRLSTLPERIEELDKTKEIVFVCRSGKRSAMAADFADNQGFQTTNMVGGMLAWEGPTKTPEK
ncbi:rhodanese-like domain-containing protein [Aureibacillus halotolerans]|uniref:Rhodanese-related sulfurtransferase n=1 Tax=Aureibacillus halotolerans TaxID=1508390 RepID=A0A4R6U077_9BACI|nr:rhodanese-like domain-containing protein [Aureibacillus halotolerans]TDQ39056.1 rhodanese-related sulfurtransferase [Aureibacillus halotolerans]